MKMLEIVSVHLEREATVVPEQEDTLKKDIHDAVELMKSLSLNWVESTGRGRGRSMMGRKAEKALSFEMSPGGIGRERISFFCEILELW